MDNKLLVIKGICASPYIDQYIIKLKDNKVLFSIEDNLHPCYETEPGKYAAQYWNGLDILESYSKNKELNNDDTNDFIISLINSVIDTMINDDEEDYHKRFSGNWGNMWKIYSIIASKAIFIKKIKVLDFVKECLSNRMNGCDFILTITRDNKENFFLNDASIFFGIHELFIENDLEDFYFGYLYGQSIVEFIKRAPYKYFVKSKKWLEKTECIFSTMGAIEEYSRKAEYKIEKEDVLFDWFKQSAKYINGDLIEAIIQEYLDSEKKMLNKMAVFLLSIRFDEAKSLLFEKMDKIIKNHNVYSDLRVLLENNVSKMTDEEKAKIYDCVQNSEIDEKRGRISSLLRNRLYMILNLSGFKCFYRQETPKEKEIVDNYNKLISFSNRDMDEDISSCKSEMDSKSFEEILSEYYVNNKSFYFGDVINKSVWLYVQENNINICEYVDVIPDILSISLINRMIEKKDYECLTNYLTLFIEKEHFEREALQTILFAFRTIYENNNEKTDIILKFDYRKIPVSSIEFEQVSVVAEIINESIFEYLDLLSIVAYKNELIRERFFDAINYYIDKGEQGWKIKAVLGYLIQRILELNKDFFSKNIDYILNNNKGNINPSYHTISWSNSYSEELFDYLIFREDFIRFFQENDSKIEDSIQKKKVMMAKVIKYYYKTDKGLNVLKEIIQLIYKYSITKIYSQLSLEIYLEKEKGIKEIDTKRINSIIKYIDEADYINKLGPDFNYDYLSREIAIFIIRSNNCSKLLWKHLLVAFEKYNRYFYDEIYELVKEYKNSEFENIRKLLKIYFNKYTPYSADEETIKNVFNTIKDEPKYEKDSRKWRTSLTKINPDLEI